MRHPGMLLLVLLALPTAQATDLVGVPDLLGGVDALQRLLVPQPDASLGQELRSWARPDPGPGAQSAAPPSPAGEAVGAAQDAVLWLLGALGGVAGVALGWRHLHLRNALDHPGRAAILQLLRRRPGLHLRAVARELGMPVQHANYHLRVLERVGLVKRLEAAGKVCWHEAGTPPEARRALLEAALLPSMAQQQVMAFIATHPGASQSEVARQLGMLQGRARWHLRKLVAQGKLLEQRQGKALVYQPSSGPRP
jgi:predicted transcriptional regulator